MCILHNIASSFYCDTCRLEFKIPLPPAKKQKTLACIREIQVHKLWTKVYSQKGSTAMDTTSTIVVITLNTTYHVLVNIALPVGVHTNKHNI